jgi:hypothetical protein
MKQKNIILFGAFITLVIGLTYLLLSWKDNKAEEIIKKSIEAHGGMNAWEDLQELNFKKLSVLYTSDGAVESEQDQRLNFRFKPYFEGSIRWEKEGMLHVIKYDGIKTQYQMGENEVTNSDFLSAKKRDFDAAFYVMDKPFSLLKDGLHLTYEGIDTLRDGQIVERIKIIDGDPNDPNNDVWFYFFDLENYRLIAYQVKTDGHSSQVYNETFIQSSGLILPATRSSYRLDQNGKHNYLRATYIYSKYEIIN